MNWLSALEKQLDETPRPITFFFRDDDAGWGDRQLLALLDLFAVHHVPVDLAAIPTALSPPLVGELNRRLMAMPAHIGIHQHGYSHINHEVNGRKYEFGPTRSSSEQYADLAAGQACLQAHFALFVDPIFTPPWNRCTRETVAQIERLGFRALSRDHSAPEMPLGKLVELPVAVDWCRYSHEGSEGFPAMSRRIADESCMPQSVGIMLHHAVMESGQLMRLSELLSLLAEHAHAECKLMREICFPGCDHAEIGPSVA